LKGNIVANIDLNNVDSTEFDVLKELGNIGAGNATTALSSMINAKVDMKVPKVELLTFEELHEIVGGAETTVAGILVTLDTDIEGMMMFLMRLDAAWGIIDVLFGRKPGSTPPDTPFDEMSMSALKEIGNIITGAYISSLSQLTRLTIGQSVPYLSVDMAGAILSVPAIEFGKLGDRALLIESTFLGDNNDVTGYFILTPTIESYNKILSSLGL
jgi:chemotaxis protein CheC